MTDIKDLKEEQLLILLQDAAKNWLAHDGLWFQAVENRFGMETALEIDTRAWEKFTVIEARRILKFLDKKPGGGIETLIQALKFRLYAHINVQEVLEASETRCVLRMNNCRVQEARRRKGLPDFPCKSVGLAEYSGFAQTIDARIKTRCLACPPDPHPPEFWCAWEFSLEE